jgi:GMP synthase-like glutamine amidotransferase
MKVGLLVCDHVPDELVGIAGDYEDMFRRLFVDHTDVELVAYDVINGALPSNPTECHAWITTGSRHSVNDDLPWIHDLARFIMEAPAGQTPLIGVCFGHQLIARALGGSVVRSMRGWGLGSTEVQITHDNPLPAWMEPITDKYRILNSHADQVEQTPAGARVLGSTEHCPVSLMTVGEFLLGIQGHPEMEAPYLRSLIQTRRGRRVPESTAQRAIDSLELGSDSILVRRWMLNFMESRV